MSGISDHALRVLGFAGVLERIARHASSGAGAEHIKDLRPSTAPGAVEASLDAVEQMRRYVEASPGWAPPALPEVAADLDRLGVEGAVLGGEGLRRLAVLLASSRKLRSDLLADEEEHLALSSRARELIREPELEKRLERSLDESGRVVDAASDRLRKIRARLRDARNGLVSRLEAFVRELSERHRLPDASVTVRNGRYCIPIRREGRSAVGGIVHDESSSGQTLFVEPPPAIDPMNRIRELEGDESREVQRVLRELTGRLRPLEGELRLSRARLVELDSLFGRARYATDHGGFRPEVTDGHTSEVSIVEGYHPLLLETEDEAVPFGLTLAPGERVLLVSGPNAGGKTVLLKALGLLSALAQAGVVPPVGDGTRLPLFRSFFAIIGDEQSIEASLSTFSAQVETLKTLLAECGPRSLVLLDEFGSHTDPSEGAALAASVLLHLAGRARLTVATTHLGALKALAGEDERVVNASLQFDAEALRPTYRLRRDRPGRSYALEIAERLGLPAELVDEARSRVGGEERRLEGVLSELEARERELSDLKDEVEELRSRLRRRQDELDARREEVERRESEVERDARERAEAYLLEARQEVEEAIERLESEYRRAAGSAEGGAGSEARGEAASRARSRVERALRETRDRRPEPSAKERREPADVAAGDAVRIVSLDRRATVREVRDEKAVVEAGEVRLTLPLTDLELADEDDESGAPDRSAARASAVRAGPAAGVEPRSEVHLRGLRVDEVERELIPYLDAAIVADLPRLRIVHGKGTGALRGRVRELLAADPRVEDFRDGGPGEGGRGVTVVEFRSDRD